MVGAARGTATCGRRGPDSRDLYSDLSRHSAIYSCRSTRGSSRRWLRTITHNKLTDYYCRRQAGPHIVGGTDFYQQLQNLPDDPHETSATEQSVENSLFLRALELLRADFEERTWQAFWRLTVEQRTASQNG